MIGRLVTYNRRTVAEENHALEKSGMDTNGPVEARKKSDLRVASTVACTLQQQVSLLN